jgi:hypothetical protein
MSARRAVAASALARPEMPAATKSTRRLTVDLPVDVHRAFRQLALDLDTDTSALMRRLVAQALAEAAGRGARP